MTETIRFELLLESETTLKTPQLVNEWISSHGTAPAFRRELRAFARFVEKQARITVSDIELQREQAQNDILCILDGLDNTFLDNVCQVIVDRFNILKSKLEE